MQIHIITNLFQIVIYLKIKFILFLPHKFNIFIRLISNHK